MPRLRRMLRHLLIADAEDALQLLGEMSAHVDSLRHATQQVYEELELALAGLDMLTERCRTAQLALEVRHAAARILAPEQFTFDQRQRETKVI